VSASCGSGDPDEKTTAVTIGFSDGGPYDVRIDAPRKVPAGLVEIELRNRGKALHDAQLFRLDGDRSAGHIVGALEAPDNEAKPRWLHPSGGVAPVRPGESATVRQVLTPGVYYVADTQERAVPSGGKLVNASKGGIARIEVTGNTTAELPEGDATIVAKEYGYDVKGIDAGDNLVEFRNAGRQFHQAIAFPLEDGIGIGAAKRRVIAREREIGWVPVDTPTPRATAVLEGGGEQIVGMTFRPGRYLLLCFVSDRAGGGPQWLIGMTRTFEVAAD
jgi:hypothetical protein